MYSFSYLEPVHCSMSSSNCCFLTCIQVSQEVGQVVWYSHRFQNFPQFFVIHTVKGSQYMSFLVHMSRLRKQFIFRGRKQGGEILEYILNWGLVYYYLGFPGGSLLKNPPANLWSLIWEDPLEKEMVAHSGILAWEIPWTEESGGLQSMGSERVGRDWETNTFTSFFHIIIYVDCLCNNFHWGIFYVKHDLLSGGGPTPDIH